MNLRFIVCRERTVHDKVCSGLLRPCALFLPFAVTIIRILGTATGACVPTAITIELITNYFSNIKFLYITYNKPPIRSSRCSPNVQGQTASSMGESFFSPCTRHVSMYLRHGIVIHSFILSVPRGIIFISVLGHYPRFA
jgi:hypothetical protein